MNKSALAKLMRISIRGVFTMKNQFLVRSFLLLVALGLGAYLVPLARVEAATNVPCDTTALVNAIQDAVNAGGTQTLKLAQNCTYTLTQPNFGKNNSNATGLPKIQKVNLTLKGSGATIQRDANAPPFRILYVEAGSEVKLQNLTISGGRTPDGKPGDGGGDGGGIYNKGNLKLDRVVVTNNTTGKGSDATSPTGGGFAGGSGGGITNYYGELLIEASTVSNNKTGDSGTEGANGSTPYGAGVGGAIVNLHGKMRIFNSTLSGNATGDSTNKTTHGGYGGAIYSVSNTFITEITNSTFSGNRAGAGGQFGKSGGITGDYVIKNSTFANNVGSKGNSTSADYRRAIDSIQGGSKLSNTLVANTGNNLNCSIGSVTNVANNLDTGTSCGFGSANGSKSNANPNLGPLAHNGGPTQTHAFTKPSDAFNKGNNDVCNAAPVNGKDQRGTARPQGKKCDIGAFEL